MTTTATIPRGRLGDLLRAFLHDGDDPARARRGAVTAFSIRLASAALAYATQVLLARWMGAHDYGIFAYCWVWLTILGVVTPIGINTSVLRFLPEYDRQGNMALVRGLITGSRTFAFATSTLFALLGAGAVYLTDGLVAPEYAVPLYLVLICLPMFALTDTQEGIARAYSWINLGLLPPYIVRPALLLTFLAAALAAGAQASAQTAVLCTIGATWFAAIGQSVLLGRRLATRVTPGPRAFEPKRWLAVSLPILIVEGFYVVLANTDVLVLNIYLGPAEAGIYYAALKTTMLISFIYYAVCTAYAHRFAEYKASGDRDALTHILGEAVRWTFWPSLAAAFCVLALGWPLLWLFGEDFTAAYPVMFVLVIGLLARAAVGPVEFMLTMLGEERLCALVLAASAAANVAFNFTLIPRYGLIGAAVATTSSAILATVLLQTLASRRLGLPLFGWAPRRRDRLVTK